MTNEPQGQAGFTLVEAMVALVILGIAAAGIVRAIEGHVDSIGALEQRAAGQWVAENALAEMSLGTKPGIVRSDVEMLGTQWSVDSRIARSEDPDLRLATIRVRPKGSDGPVVSLQGFIDAGTITP